jgi:hypothetical protein
VWASKKVIIDHQYIPVITKHANYIERIVELTQKYWVLLLYILFSTLFSKYLGLGITLTKTFRFHSHKGYAVHCDNEGVMIVMNAIYLLDKKIIICS